MTTNKKDRTTLFVALARMCKHTLWLIILPLVSEVAQSMPADSLAVYMQTAARNNPQVNAEFLKYRAALEKVPQAGAFSDPELEIGVFLQPMEILDGRQIADFQLMQMFPWFGTRKAARNEATEMSRMAYAQFRETRDNLYFEVKSQWYNLAALHEQYKNTKANLLLLEQLRQLALVRFRAPSLTGGSGSVTQAAPSASTIGAGSPSSGMQGMGGMSSGSPSTQTSAGASSGGMQGMSSSMGGGAQGGMVDVLTIQIEALELENRLAILAAERRTAEARFNALLNRPFNTPVTVTDTLVQLRFALDDKALADSITAANPMLAMIESEGKAYQAKARMDKKMSYPMFGIGLQYSLIGKRDDNMASMLGMSDMNGRDMIMPMFKISLPLFRRKYNAQQRESRYYWQSSRHKYDQTHNELQTAAIAARQQLDDAGRRVEMYIRQYELSREIWQLTLRSFAAATVPLTDAIRAERQMLDYQLKKSEAVAAYNTQVAALEKLVSAQSAESEL